MSSLLGASCLGWQAGRMAGELLASSLAGGALASVIEWPSARRGFHYTPGQTATNGEVANDDRRER